ncbi:cNMP [Seminavis robusta]|uniref:CNMP n=1 Tax=Seminavis robusta TaxID=568900 RepID=A0A9N8ECG0_9STRA|nr:cNMP [Seminavis robusta]|eukprot:Sro969_g226150.1 cNMP (316) ;mRNA; r:5866-6813
MIARHVNRRMGSTMVVLLSGTRRPQVQQSRLLSTTSRKISSTASTKKSATAIDLWSLPKVSNLKSILPLELVLHPTTKKLLPVIGHASYLALASGFLMTDMLQLRVMLVGGYTGLVAFHTLHERPLRIPLRWSALFVAVNAVAAGLVIMDRYAPTLSDRFVDGEELYAEYFSSLSRGQFHQLLSLAQRRQSVPAGTVLTRENVSCQQMFFIVDGKALVYHGRTNATIEQGGFVNDVAFQRGPHAGAYGTVVTTQESDVLVWDLEALRKHLQSRPEMERAFKYCMSDHLVKSLLRQREATHKRQRTQRNPQIEMDL